MGLRLGLRHAGLPVTEVPALGELPARAAEIVARQEVLMGRLDDRRVILFANLEDAAARKAAAR
jgi:hypothetical protein